MDHILCKYHDELYPGLYKPHFLKTYYRKLGKLMNKICKVCLICSNNCCICLCRSIKSQEIKDMILLEDEEDKVSDYGFELVEV